MTSRPPGLLAGRYRVGALIGAGGSVDVHAAHDRRLDVPVAVRLTRAPDAGAGAQACAWARVVHPAVARVLDAGVTDDGRAWTVTDLVDGTDLAAVLADGTPIGVADALAVLAAVLDGLAAAHAVGVVHGDLSPGNVLLPVAAGRPVWTAARLTDLAAPVQVGGSVVVSPHYAAPEVARGSSPTPASDLYAAGALGMHLLTGGPPFPGAPAQALRNQVLGVAPRASARVPTLSRPVDDLLATALVKDPGRRFAGAVAMADAVRSAAALVEPGRASASDAVTARPAASDAVTVPTPASDVATARPGTSVVVTARTALPGRAGRDGRPPGTRPLPPVTPDVPPVRRAARRGGWVTVLAGALLVGGVLAGGLAAIAWPRSLPVTAEVPSGSPSTATTAAPPTLTPTPTPTTRSVRPSPSPVTVAVPTVVGLDAAVAGQALAGVGLVVGTVTEQDGPAAAGTVLASDPQVGALLAPGAAVALQVASGLSAVPVVAGLDATGARTALEQAGFPDVTVQEVPAGASATGVVGTLPAAGAVLTVGSPVRLLVASPVRVTPTPTATSDTPTPTPTSSP